MVESLNISNLDIDYILSLPEVINAKYRIDSQTEGSIYFNIDLNESLRKILLEKFGLEFSKINSIPMRWIKGDTKPHIDKSSHSFDKTYLAYLTDSPGELIVDDESYPIVKGNAYVFSEGLSHETIGTCFEPRLLLGPMSESGISVGGDVVITANGETDTIYVKFFFEEPGLGTGNFYRINNGSWNPIVSSPTVTIINSNTAYRLKVLIEDFIGMNNDTERFSFVCASDNIQFGSTSLTTSGTRVTIGMGSIENYPGLIRNGTTINPGYNNIYVFNLFLQQIGGSTLTTGSGWIGQSYFGKGATNNFIVNCIVSTGPIPTDGGGILGSYCGSGTGATLYITGCTSNSIIADGGGGIIGSFAGFLGGQVICENCWSTATIIGGGIFGRQVGNSGGTARAINCYSQGNSTGSNAGGIFGTRAGSDGTATAENCYSRGNFESNCGGLFGPESGITGGSVLATNCYVSGTNTGNPFFGSGTQNAAANYCYDANGTWDSTAANLELTGIPDPVVGTTWVETVSDEPYELNNMGYTPYTITNISSTNTLVQTYSVSLNPGNSSSPAIISGVGYTILQKSGGNPSSYETITIDESTGSILTTSETTSGAYTLYIRNPGSYNITVLNLTIESEPTPPGPTPGPTPDPDVPICFPAGTPVLTDQGEVPIDKIDINKHTIQGKQIVSLIKSVPSTCYLVCIEKNSLANNVPKRRTFITRDHKIMYQNQMIKAEKLCQISSNFYMLKYNNLPVYNVLLKDHSTMNVNNLIVETMYPKHILAKIYSGNYTPQEKNTLITIFNKYSAKQKQKQNKNINMRNGMVKY
jgi:hypothetical protein